MRKLIFSILLASAAASPALAQEHGRWQQDEAQGDRQAAHEERQQQREQARAERTGGNDAPRPQPQLQQQAEPDRTARFEVREDQRGGFDGHRFEQHNNVQADVQAPPPSEQRRFDGHGFEQHNNVQADVQAPPPSPEPPRQFDGRDRANWNGGERRGWNGDRHNWTGSGQVQSGDLRHSDRPVPNVMRDPNPLIVSNTPREGTQPPPRTDLRRHSGNWSGNWNGSWRNDSRYDWRHWRDRHRSWFHIGFYYDPFGWQYRPYQIGWRLWPSYYSRNYWIDDPWQYRLPYAPPGTVWVRYWDDALLVDVYSGEVIDVIHNFFW